MDPTAGFAEQLTYTPDGARYLKTTTVGSASATLIEVSPLFELQYASSGFSYSRELFWRAIIPWRCALSATTAPSPPATGSVKRTV